MAAVPHFWPRPTTRLHDPTRHATPSVPNRQKYETAKTPPDRYGSTRIGKFLFLRLESASDGLILEAILHFRPQPATMAPIDTKRPNVPNKHKMRNRRDASGTLLTPSGRQILLFTTSFRQSRVNLGSRPSFFGTNQQPASMTPIDMKHQTYRISINTKPPQRHRIATDPRGSVNFACRDLNPPFPG